LGGGGSAESNEAGRLADAPGTNILIVAPGEPTDPVTHPSTLDHVRPEDSEFVRLFLETSEFGESDKEYPGYVNFNLGAVARGEQVSDVLEQQFPIKGAAVLDIGAGSGGVAIALAKRGAIVHAIEPDQTRLAWAQARIRGHGATVMLSKASAETLPYPDGSFDAICCDSVIEHVPSPRRAIAEMCRVTKSGSAFYVTTPNRFSLLNIYRDPHYQFFGVILMPRPIGKWYVERVRRVPRGYWVYRVPRRSWLLREFKKHGVILRFQPPPEFQKLRDPGTITRTRWIRPLARVFLALRAGGLLESLASAQYPSNLYVGTKLVAEKGAFLRPSATGGN
jgi:2-polyprenyl-3-methyl-5-hydroxy-6-metoxy-1,4-benzoquinol methylase